MTASRRLVTLTGDDALTFLQGLVSNDVRRLDQPGIVYAALLTPQGKYLADFFVVNTGEVLLLDLPEGLADTTLRRLSMYRLRADVQMGPHQKRTQGQAEVDEGDQRVTFADIVTRAERP